MQRTMLLLCQTAKYNKIELILNESLTAAYKGRYLGEACDVYRIGQKYTFSTLHIDATVSDKIK